MRDLGSGTDDELLRKMQAGSEAAFTTLYRRHERAVHGFAFQMSGSVAVAEEVTQEVFLALIRRPGRFDPNQGPLEAFLHGVARNHVLQCLARDRRYVGQEEEGGPEQVAAGPDALSELVTGQRVAELRKAVLSLPVAYREALVLCDLEEMEYERAAEVIGCPVGTVRSRLHRARALLSGKLGAGKKSCTV